MFSLVSDGPSQLVLEQVNKYGVLRTVALSRSLFLSVFEGLDWLDLLH